jgi:hypothetical protein
VILAKQELMLFKVLQQQKANVVYLELLEDESSYYDLNLATLLNDHQMF